MTRLDYTFRFQRLKSSPNHLFTHITPNFLNKILYQRWLQGCRALRLARLLFI